MTYALKVYVLKKQILALLHSQTEIFISYLRLTMHINTGSTNCTTVNIGLCALMEIFFFDTLHLYILSQFLYTVYYIRILVKGFVNLE
jgi:hypothetical protein